MKQLTAETKDHQMPFGISKNNVIVLETFAHIDTTALGAAIGILFGAILFFSTNFLVLKGGERIGPTMSLLNQYFPGYSVTLTGSVIGLLYGFEVGFLLGFSIALLRNVIVKIYLYLIKFKARMRAIGEFLDS